MIERNVSFIEDHALGIVITRQKAIAGANPESHSIISFRNKYT